MQNIQEVVADAIWSREAVKAILGEFPKPVFLDEFGHELAHSPSQETHQKIVEALRADGFH